MRFLIPKSRASLRSDKRPHNSAHNTLLEEILQKNPCMNALASSLRCPPHAELWFMTTWDLSTFNFIKPCGGFYQKTFDLSWNEARESKGFAMELSMKCTWFIIEFQSSSPNWDVWEKVKEFLSHHNTQIVTPKRIDHFQGVNPISSEERFQSNQAWRSRLKNCSNDLGWYALTKNYECPHSPLERA